MQNTKSFMSHTLSNVILYIFTIRFKEYFMQQFQIKLPASCQSQFLNVIGAWPVLILDSVYMYISPGVVKMLIFFLSFFYVRVSYACVSVCFYVYVPGHFEV